MEEKGPSIEQQDEVTRPSFKNMFKVKEAKQIIKECLTEYLEDKKYDASDTQAWAKEISVNIRTKLCELKLPRYKFMVQVMIGEMKGAGCRLGSRCLWDAQTDKLAQETFINDSLFAVGVAFGLYLY